MDLDAYPSLFTQRRYLRRDVPVRDALLEAMPEVVDGGPPAVPDGPGGRAALPRVGGDRLAATVAEGMAGLARRLLAGEDPAGGGDAIAEAVRATVTACAGIHPAGVGLAVLAVQRAVRATFESDGPMAELLDRPPETRRPAVAALVAEAQRALAAGVARAAAEGVLVSRFAEAALSSRLALRFGPDADPLGAEAEDTLTLLASPLHPAIAAGALRAARAAAMGIVERRRPGRPGPDDAPFVQRFLPPAVAEVPGETLVLALASDPAAIAWLLGNLSRWIELKTLTRSGLPEATARQLLTPATGLAVATSLVEVLEAARRWEVLVRLGSAMEVGGAGWTSPRNRTVVAVGLGALRQAAGSSAGRRAAVDNAWRRATRGLRAAVAVDLGFVGLLYFDDPVQALRHALHLSRSLGEGLPTPGVGVASGPVIGDPRVPGARTDGLAVEQAVRWAVRRRTERTRKGRRLRIDGGWLSGGTVGADLSFVDALRAAEVLRELPNGTGRKGPMDLVLTVEVDAAVVTFAVVRGVEGGVELLPLRRADWARLAILPPSADEPPTRAEPATAASVASPLPFTPSPVAFAPAPPPDPVTPRSSPLALDDDEPIEMHDGEGEEPPSRPVELITSSAEAASRRAPAPTPVPDSPTAARPVAPAPVNLDELDPLDITVGGPNPFDGDSDTLVPASPPPPGPAEFVPPAADAPGRAPDPFDGDPFAAVLGRSSAASQDPFAHADGPAAADPPGGPGDDVFAAGAPGGASEPPEGPEGDETFAFGAVDDTFAAAPPLAEDPFPGGGDPLGDFELPEPDARSFEDADGRDSVGSADAFDTPVPLADDSFAGPAEPPPEAPAAPAGPAWAVAEESAPIQPPAAAAPPPPVGEGGLGDWLDDSLLDGLYEGAGAELPGPAADVDGAPSAAAAAPAPVAPPAAPAASPSAPVPPSPAPEARATVPSGAGVASAAADGDWLSSLLDAVPAAEPPSAPAPAPRPPAGPQLDPPSAPAGFSFDPPSAPVGFSLDPPSAPAGFSLDPASAARPGDPASAGSPARRGGFPPPPPEPATAGRAADPPTNTSARAARASRPPPAVDFGQLLRGYTLHYDGNRAVFGRPYGKRVVDRHAYPMSGGVDTAYRAFLKDKIAEGFVPRADLIGDVPGGAQMTPLDPEALERAWRTLA